MTKELSQGMTRNLAGFSEALREAGLPTHVRALVDAARSAALLDLADRTLFKTALRANFVTDRGRYPLFDHVFDTYWAKVELPPQGCDGCHDDKPEIPQFQAANLSDGEESRRAPPSKEGASDRETLVKKDFRAVTPDEGKELREILLRILAKLPTRPGRRYRPAPRGRSLDFRRTMREASRHGGEFLSLTRREPRLTRRKLVFLGDVSGSMDLHTRFFFHLAFGFSRHEKNTEVFAFSTKLFDLTWALHVGRKGIALDRALEDTSGWSGGTRIGECLNAFNDTLARRPHLARTTVIVLSDGWDRGDAAALSREIVRLKGSVKALYWLNPLKGEPGYKPLSRGMATVLPYLDGFFPANNLASLAQFAAKLGRAA